MNVKLKKNVSAKIYFNQIQGCLLLNGRLIKANSINLHIFINLLKSLSISVNIITNKKRYKIVTSKLLLEISKKIKEINRNKNNSTENNNTIIQNVKSNINKKFNFYEFISQLFSIRLLIICIAFIVFLSDYKSTVNEMNEKNVLEIKELEKDYKINKCKENGYLPSLKPICESMLYKIEILKNKKFSTLSVFSIWLSNVWVKIKETFGLQHSILIIILIIIFKKIY